MGKTFAFPELNYPRTGHRDRLIPFCDLEVGSFYLRVDEASLYFKGDEVAGLHIVVAVGADEHRDWCWSTKLSQSPTHSELVAKVRIQITFERLEEIPFHEAKCGNVFSYRNDDAFWIRAQKKQDAADITCVNLSSGEVKFVPKASMGAVRRLRRSKLQFMPDSDS